MHFWQKIEKRGCPTHLFLIICPFLCNYLVLKYIERVIFFVKFYLNPKEFYTRAARDKFHVCCTVSSCGVEFVLSCFVHGMKKFQGFGPKLAINQSQSIIQPNWPQETNQNVLSGGKCLYSCNHNLLLRKRLWPQSMVSITVPVLHQNHISVRKIYKNKWKILLFQVFLDFLLVIIVHKEDGKETFVLFLELKCTFAKVGSHLQSYIFSHNFDEIYPSRYSSQRNAAFQLTIVQTVVFIRYHMI